VEDTRIAAIGNVEHSGEFDQVIDAQA